MILNNEFVWDSFTRHPCRMVSCVTCDVFRMDYWRSCFVILRIHIVRKPYYFIENIVPSPSLLLPRMGFNLAFVSREILPQVNASELCRLEYNSGEISRNDVGQIASCDEAFLLRQSDSGEDSR